jgi:hypothetical protein
MRYWVVNPAATSIPHHCLSMSPMQAQFWAQFEGAAIASVSLNFHPLIDSAAQRQRYMCQYICPGDIEELVA